MVSTDQIRQYMEEVFDPEVPVLTIVDLGVLRKVEVIRDTVKITITPTYSGCPAMKRIEDDIVELLKEKGIDKVEVDLVLSPAWTTDWLSAEGRVKLKEYGIAPPENEMDKSVLFAEPTIVPCPKCDSRDTKLVSQFGSTACKAHYQCNTCLEPYDYFKCLK
ncbi:phenylacetate-CoA oxygenase subunit PaaJ [Crocinitomicaceae bacterium]|jgi:ring-1,2-phenylacetyl-CoA epoxidase subunit PaaD|nr:phenylacetate-CoA oxygenase subunit PaaJ [Crocinitomicaceae bacterium]MDA9299110.1 phenylacetate-CoA oxygenase subunit PaaJ [Crocinitomicaceae bacterium]MDC0100056.1 phenylacetate-CoA oxygenase subunit PaaJ [Crocinitomicaceae bacterium]MDC1196144.1 phenylacetate-CoA oxygenase subunit PaaJ [Crocinitomicaceae bacterium]MDC1384461.1 phenylacetate-CoA oxygenase subunit PaaJ [Crocinitomicaceae bacterium]|tara:strand:+ start:708 stop:1193 length:486 start_codon:yes stop_codon:yes gene_type:complete